MSNITRSYIQKEIDQRNYIDWTKVRPSTKLIITMEDALKDISYNVEGWFIAYYKGYVIVDINNLHTIYAINPKQCRLPETDCQCK